MSSQQQTADSFGYKWARTDAYGSPRFLEVVREWQFRHFGRIPEAAWWSEYGPRPKVLDAGCGGGISAIELFGERLHRIDYTGLDISGAQDLAAERFKSQGLPGTFVQADMSHPPFPNDHFDVVVSIGAMHHTDSTVRAFHALARTLKKGGRFLFYVYKKKSPIREFTDDLIRDSIKGLSPEAAWEALYPLTRLGEALGKLNTMVDVPQAVPTLGIPAGPIDVQRLFYWHIFKCYYRPEWTLDEMHHVNFDWFAPQNCHRHTPEEVRRWCARAVFDIERENIDEAGIAITAIRSRTAYPTPL
jgi:arsenite methyltransferase